MDERLLNDIKREVRKEAVSVTQYRYRTAYVTHILLEMPRDDELEELLSKKSGKRIDNHTLYQLTFSDGENFSMLFSDRKMYLGLGVSKMNW